jgi:hypothetical protein
MKNNKKDYELYVEQKKDCNGNYIQYWSVYKSPKAKIKLLKTFDSLSKADKFLDTYESN